jgi:hypothetical protein
LNEKSDVMDENMFNGMYESSSDLGHTVPVLKKVLDLSTKILDSLFLYFVFNKLIRDFMFCLVFLIVLIYCDSFFVLGFEIEEAS